MFQRLLNDFRDLDLLLRRDQLGQDELKSAAATKRPALPRESGCSAICFLSGDIHYVHQRGEGRGGGGVLIKHRRRSRDKLLEVCEGFVQHSEAG